MSSRYNMGLLDGLFTGILSGVLGSSDKSIIHSPIPTTHPITTGPPIPNIPSTIPIYDLINSLNITYKYIIPFESEEVNPIKGSVLVTDLAILFEHTGIYIGDKKIVHRSGDGYIEKVTNDKFKGRLSGFNPAFITFVACIDGEPFNNNNIYTRAISSLNISHNQHNGYRLLSKNCHNFTRYCLTGDEDQWGLDFTFDSLQKLLREKFGVNSWRVLSYQ